MTSGSINISADGLQIKDDHKNVFIPWTDIVEIRAYKDKAESCVCFKAGEWFYEARESYSGFKDLHQICEYKRGLRMHISRFKNFGSFLADERDLILFERGDHGN